MRKPVGELTIEPDPLPEKVFAGYEHILQRELANVTSNTSGTTLRLADVAMVHLYTDYGNTASEATYGLRADVCDDISSEYKKLFDGSRRTDNMRSRLVWEVKDAMARQSLLLDPNAENDEEYYHESRVFMDHQPLFFEPFNHAMLMGHWDRRRQNKLKFEALDIPTQEQRLILLGGFAAFLNFLKQ